MDEAIRTLDVRFLYAYTVHAGLTTLALCSAVVDEVVVGIGDALVDQLLLDEVHQWHRGVIGHADHRGTTFTIATPVRVVGHLRGFDDTHRVEGCARRKAAHALSFAGRCALNTRQTVQLHRVVNHAAEEQQFLLRGSEALIAPHTPKVVTVEALKGGIVGHKERLRTCLAQHFPIAKIVNQANGVLVVALLGQPTVDARSPSLWSALIQIILTARTQHASTSNQRGGSSQQPQPKASAGFHFVIEFAHILVLNDIHFSRQIVFTVQSYIKNTHATSIYVQTALLSVNGTFLHVPDVLLFVPAIKPHTKKKTSGTY